MVKETEKLTEKGEFSSHALPISVWFPKETLVASWHWQVSMNPRQVSAISLMRSPRNHRAGRFIHSHKHTVELVKYSGNMFIRRTKN